MTYKELIENPWYASIIVFVTQIIFLFTERKTHPSFLRGWDVSDKY
jgi:hypothetical protein